MDKLDEIKKLKSLFDQGAITQNEFTAFKKKLFGDNNVSSGLNSHSINDEKSKDNSITNHLQLPGERLAEEEVNHMAFQKKESNSTENLVGTIKTGYKIVDFLFGLDFSK